MRAFSRAGATWLLLGWSKELLEVSKCPAAPADGVASVLKKRGSRPLLASCWHLTCGKACCCDGGLLECWSAHAMPWQASYALRTRGARGHRAAVQMTAIRLAAALSCRIDFYSNFYSNLHELRHRILLKDYLVALSHRSHAQVVLLVYITTHVFHKAHSAAMQ